MLKKWKLHKKEEVFKCKYLSVEKRQYELPNGKIVGDYYHVKRSDFVLIIARTSDDRILLEKTYRRGVDEYSIEVPAGFIEEDEGIVASALRELEEETGYTGKATLLGEIFVQPGYMNQKAYVVLVDVDKNPKYEIRRDPDEDIELEWVTEKQLDRMVQENIIKDMGCLSALAFYGNVKL